MGDKNPEATKHNIKDLVAPFLLKKLQKAPFEIRQLFPVQVECLQHFRAGGRQRDFDLLVSAATGSGKTLAFAIPIVQNLIKRIVCRVRAVVVLPTRDLALQVKKSFDDLCAGEKLRVGLAVGASSFAVEQGNLMLDNYAGLAPVFGDTVEDSTDSASRWSSKVDILVATPGRLVDHITSTPGFTLDHLEYLVIDEADRLMSQHYQGWLDVVYKHLKPYAPLMPSIVHRQSSLPVLQKRVQKMLFSATLTRNPEKLERLKLLNPIYVTVSQIDELMMQSDPAATSLADQIAPSQNDDTRKDAIDYQDGMFLCFRYLYASFRLIKRKSLHPQLAVMVDLAQTSLGAHQFTVPSTLKEDYIVLEASQKPLALLYLILTKKLDGVVVFVKSVQSANRLASLLQEATNKTVNISALSSDQSSGLRKSILEEFVGGNSKSFSTQHVSKKSKTSAEKQLSTIPRLAQVLICTDLMGRGIDLTQSVSTIINYDIPSNLPTYIHRIGRTARAGGQGQAISFIEKGGQLKWWRRNICHCKDQVARVRDVDQLSVETEEMAVYQQDYLRGLEHLQKVYGSGSTRSVEAKTKAKQEDESSSSSSSSSDSSDSSDSKSSGSSDSSSDNDDGFEEDDAMSVDYVKFDQAAGSRTTADWRANEWTSI